MHTIQNIATNGGLASTEQNTIILATDRTTFVLCTIHKRTTFADSLQNGINYW